MVTETFVVSCKAGCQFLLDRPESTLWAECVERVAEGETCHPVIDVSDCPTCILQAYWSAPEKELTLEQQISPSGVFQSRYSGDIVPLDYYREDIIALAS